MGKERHCNCKLGQELFTCQRINPKLKFLSVVTFVLSSLYLHIFVEDIGNRSDDQEGAGTQNTNIECYLSKENILDNFNILSSSLQ